jgi:hypothetical protein
MSPDLSSESQTFILQTPFKYKHVSLTLLVSLSPGSNQLKRTIECHQSSLTCQIFFNAIFSMDDDAFYIFPLLKYPILTNYTLPGCEIENDGSVLGDVLFGDLPPGEQTKCSQNSCAKNCCVFCSPAGEKKELVKLRASV